MPQDRDTLDAGVLARTARRYRACGRFTRHYVASKVKRDPVHLALLALGRTGSGQPGFGQVVDVGCGRGQVAVALLEAGAASSVIGLDCAGASLADARRAADGLAFTAVHCDLARAPAVPGCDTVLLIDVLYTLGAPVALALVQTSARAARSIVLIRTLDPDRGLRSLLTRTLERLGRRFWPHAGACVDPVPVASLLAVLHAAGFVTGAAEPCWRGTPFANVLIVARRAEATASRPAP